MLAPARRRLLGLLLVTLVVLLAVGCQTTAVVHLTVKPDGSGSVVVDVDLDAQAVARVPDLTRQVSLDDLRQAGWSVTGPVTQPGGAVRFRASKSFADAAGAERALAEVSGPDGPLRGLHVDRDRSLTETRERVTGTLDVSGGLEAFSDPDLTKALGGKSLSQLVGAWRLPTDPPLAQGLRLRFEVTLPGDVGAGGASVHGHTAVWEVGAGEQPEAIEATGTRHHGTTRWFVIGAIIAAALFVIALGWALRGMWRDRRARRAARKAEAERAAAVDADEASVDRPAPTRSRRRSLRRRGGGKHARRRGRPKRA